MVQASIGRGRFGEADYRQGALARLKEAYILLLKEQFAGSVYLAGRGVEGMLRAVVWKNDRDIRQGKKSLQTGHDLRELLCLIGNMGLLQESDPDIDFKTNVEKVGRLWFNNLRYASTEFIEACWRRLGETNNRRTLKKASSDYYENCHAIIKRCEVLCNR